MLRERILTWTAERRVRGDAWSALARGLGIEARTLQRWATPRRGAAPRLALRPVAVIDEPSRRTVTVVAPSGLRIEGVTLADAIALVRGLA